MPATKPRIAVDEFVIDTAMLPGQELDSDALDLLDEIADAAEAARKLLAHLSHMQGMIEGHAPVYVTREQFAVDIEIAAAGVRRHTAVILGVDGVAS